MLVAMRSAKRTSSSESIAMTTLPIRSPRLVVVPFDTPGPNGAPLGEHIELREVMGAPDPEV